MMSSASALANHWAVGGSSHRGYTSNVSDGCLKVLTWNNNVIKGKQFFPREKVASTGWQVTKALPKKPNNGIRLPKTKWWVKDMSANMKNIESQQDLDEQLLMSGDKLTVVHFFSPSCAACKALHSKVHQFAGMHPGLQFLMVNYDEQREICNRLNVHVLPMFRFYRGAEGRICSFSCTISTIHKFKDALRGHGVQTESPAAEKGLEESEIKSCAPGTDIPNATDTSQNMDGDAGPVPPNND
ncbi:hypothetical protein ACP70R_002182 [Stipagrostis hirtigluma subsp. patula]